MSSSIDEIAGIARRLTHVDHHITELRSRPSAEAEAWVGGAVFWLVAIDDMLCEANPLCGSTGSRYKTKRANEEGGKTLQAVRLARHEIAHGSALVVEDGLRFPAAMPWNFGAKFAPAEVIRDSYEARNRALKHQLLAAYTDRVAGKAPAGVLEEIRSWLEALR